MGAMGTAARERCTAKNEKKVAPTGVRIWRTRWRYSRRHLEQAVPACPLRYWSLPTFGPVSSEQQEDAVCSCRAASPGEREASLDLALDQAVSGLAQVIQRVSQGGRPPRVPTAARVCLATTSTHRHQGQDKAHQASLIHSQPRPAGHMSLYGN